MHNIDVIYTEQQGQQIGERILPSLIKSKDMVTSYIGDVSNNKAHWKRIWSKFLEEIQLFSVFASFAN